MLKPHNYNMPRSILHRLNNISMDLGIDLWVKRDDLLPLWGGGNKARKMSAIIRQAEQKGYNSIVTCGGLNSNHARAAAMAAASIGWKCRLVLHTNTTTAESCGNLLLCQLANAQVDIVKPQDIASAMKNALEELLREGFNPLEIPGGGHLPIGAQTYIEALFELQEDCKTHGWRPDTIVLPSGTGTTQAGILAGIRLANWKTRVIGISVARTNPIGASFVVEALEWLRDLYPSIGRTDVEFRDEWVYGGYEQFNSQVIDAIQYAIRTDGLILDPTYTGKAFAALLDMVKNNEIPKGAKVLFWHTGGQFNLMAADIYHNNQIQAVNSQSISAQNTNK